MWLGLVEDKFCFLQAHLSMLYVLEGNAKHYSVRSSTISMCTVTLSNSCIKASIGFASKLAEPSNGFLRALLGIPLTPQQGVDLSFW